MAYLVSGISHHYPLTWGQQLQSPASSFPVTNVLRRRHVSTSTSFSLCFTSSPRPVLFGGFVARRPVPVRNRFRVSSNSMNDVTRASALRDGKTHENFHVFEQEALIDGSSGFRPLFLSPELESKLNRVSKWVVTAVYCCFFLWKHDAEALWVAAGSILNAGLSVLLKNLLNQERPTALKSDPGMPSSHAQSIFFAVVFFTFSSVEWLGLNVFSIAISALLLACGSFFSYLRVSQQLHTVSQVVVGAVIGSVFSILWYWLWNAFIGDMYVSSTLVRIALVSGSVGICLVFVVFAMRNWLKDD